MNDDKFEILLDEADLFQGASQAPLSEIAANLSSVDVADLHTPTLERRYMFHWQVGAHRNGTWNNTASSSNVADPRAGYSSEPWDQSKEHEEMPYPNAYIINKIEAAFETIVDALLNDKNEISITLRTREARTKSNAIQDFLPDKRTRRLCFPSKSEDEAWRFSVVIRIMELMHESLRSDVVLSKRDIYYRDPALFGSQSTVDRYVDDIAFTFGVSRSALNVAAVAKGLFAGALKLHRRDGTIITADHDQEGILVPNLKHIISADLSAVKWILVIEKEAAFRSIAASPFFTSVITEGVLLTAKGYPDLSSRAFLHFLSTPSLHNNFASPAVFGLADWDPDGLAILSTYKSGSRALAHESAHHCIPRLQWLGLRSQHLSVADNDTQAAQGLIQLTARDRKKATDMLRQIETSTDLGSACRRELQTMLMSNTKAELQLMDATPDGMMNLLTATLSKL